MSFDDKRTFEQKVVLCGDVRIMLDFKVNIIWASTQENLTKLHVNNKGADQPAHPPSLSKVAKIH